MSDRSEKFTVVLSGKDVLVREYEFAPGAISSWHHHTEVTDYFYGIEGTLVLETLEPPTRRELNPGERAAVAPMTVHRTSSPPNLGCRFLLVQGLGTYDRILEPGDEQGQ